MKNNINIDELQHFVFTELKQLENKYKISLKKQTPLPPTKFTKIKSVLFFDLLLNNKPIPKYKNIHPTNSILTKLTKIDCDDYIEYINSKGFITPNILRDLVGIRDIVIVESIKQKNLNSLGFIGYSNNSIRKYSLVIQMMVDLMRKLYKFLFGEFPKQNIHITLYGSGCKKYFPSNKKKIMTRESVNSGDTLTFGDFVGIRIYRKEECLKVLFHELVHAFGIDEGFGRIQNSGYSVFNVRLKSSDILIGESVAEFMGELINCLVYSYKNEIDPMKVITREIIFGITQTNNILGYFGLGIQDVIKEDKVIVQESCAFEYYILKTIMMLNINYTLECIIKGDFKKLLDLCLSTIKSDELYQRLLLKFKRRYVEGTSSKMSSILAIKFN